MDAGRRDLSSEISGILSGKTAEYVVTHPGRSQYSQAGGGVSSCGLAALNCARIILGLHAAGLGTAQLLEELTKRSKLEDILKPCLSWSSSAHLAVEDIHKAPIFQASLELVHSHYGQASYMYFRRLMSDIAAYTKRNSISCCAVITRPPEIITCFCVADLPTELFIIFDSHPRPDKHPDGAAFIFKNNVKSTAEYLAALLRYDEHLLSDKNVQWQAQLLAHCSGDIFIARKVASNSEWANLALDASLQVLGLIARVKELETKVQGLETEKKQLDEEISTMGDQMLELDEELERVNTKYKQLRLSTATSGSGWRTVPSRSSRRNTTNDRGLLAQATHAMQYIGQAFQSPLGTPTSYEKPPTAPPAPPDPPTSRSDGRSATAFVPQANYIDPLALQLQRDFDEENRVLAEQLKELAAVQPKFFDCGVCFEQHQEDSIARVKGCDHAFCRECLRGFAASKIEDHRYPILCPTCIADSNRSQTGELDEAAMQQLGLTDEQYDVFSEMQMAQFSTIIHCRKCLNTIFVDKAEHQEAKQIACPLPGCDYIWCKACSQQIELGGPPHSCDGSSELNHLMQQHGWKHCPGCQTPAEKIAGCNHMTCGSPGCNAHFCYVCGGMIVQSVLQREIQAAVSGHYRQCQLF